jgi:hypothetical protein
MMVTKPLDIEELEKRWHTAQDLNYVCLGFVCLSIGLNVHDHNWTALAFNAISLTVPGALIVGYPYLRIYGRLRLEKLQAETTMAIEVLERFREAQEGHFAITTEVTEGRKH